MNGKFRLTYGKEIHDHLTYAEATKKFGQVVFHALTCSGDIESKPD